MNFIGQELNQAIGWNGQMMSANNVTGRSKFARLDNHTNHTSML